MIERHETISRLQAIGRSRPAAPTAERLAAIEGRVMARVSGAAGAVPPAGRRTKVLPFVVTAAAVVLLVVVASIVFATGGGSLQFDVAEGVRLELPNPEQRIPAGLGCKVRFLAN